ncbi:hypothetical protein Aduo_002234 [Ancylostoma duodenale]
MSPRANTKSPAEEIQVVDKNERSVIPTLETSEEVERCRSIKKDWNTTQTRCLRFDPSAQLIEDKDWLQGRSSKALASNRQQEVTALLNEILGLTAYRRAFALPNC